MGIAAWIELITLVLKFPDAVLQLVRVLSKTPAEKHDALVGQIQKEAASFAETGRPS